MQPNTVTLPVLIPQDVVEGLLTEWEIQTKVMDDPQVGVLAYCEDALGRCKSDLNEYLAHDVQFNRHGLKEVDSRFYHMVLGVVLDKLYSTFRIIPECLDLQVALSQNCYVFVTVDVEEFNKCRWY